MNRGKSLLEEFPHVIDRAYAQFKKRHFVEHIMSRNVVTITPNASMAEAARIMGAHRIGSLIVEVESKPIGIVTERDLLSKVLARDNDPQTVRVQTVMSFPLISISPVTTIKEAARTMMSQKGRLTVFRGEQLIGIITAADLIKSLPEDTETRMKIEDFMTKRVIMVPHDTTITDVTKLMGEKRIGSVLITRHGTPFGIFTERDLLTTFITRGKPLDTPVGNAASSPLITIPIGTSVHETALTMALKHIRRLPIVKDNKIVGIITARDLVAAYAK